MKNIFIYWTRWIFLIPVSIIVAILVEFPIHWILYSTLSGGSDPFITPYPQLPEQLITPFFRSIAFIFAGIYMAPSHKSQAGIFMFILWSIGLGLNIYILRNIEDFDIPSNIKITTVAGGLPIIIGFIGSLLTLISIRSISKDTDSEN